MGGVESGIMKQKLKKEILREFSEFLIENFSPLLNLKDWRILFKFQKGKQDSYASIDVDSVNKEAVLYLNPYLRFNDFDTLLQEISISVLHELIHCIMCDVDLALRIVINIYKHNGSEYITPFINTLYERSVESIAKVLINSSDIREVILKGIDMVKKKYGEEINESNKV